MSVELNFSGKVVVVIGGTSGLNRGIAEGFASNGARVAVASRRQEKVDDTLESLLALGAEKALGQTFDVRDFDAVNEGLSAFHHELGAFDILVSGAAGSFAATAVDMSVNAFKSVVDIDLMGTIHVMKAAFPFLKRPGASVVNISAPQAYMPFEGQSHACAAKAGVDQITRTLALEWGKEGIRINSLVPGLVEGTGGTEALTPTPEAQSRVTSAVPLGRLGTKQDMANVCLFLGSDLSSYMSGGLVVVDGALYQRGSVPLGNEIVTAMDSHNRR